MSSETPKTYLYRLQCSNCGWSGSMSQTYGKERPRKEICSSCGCLADTKTWSEL